MCQLPFYDLEWNWEGGTETIFFRGSDEAT